MISKPFTGDYNTHESGGVAGQYMRDREGYALRENKFNQKNADNNSDFEA